MISSYLFKLFFTQNNGRYRNTLLFPMLSILMGSYVIFMTMSIMGGMENDILARAQSFDYQYYIANLKPHEIEKYYNDKIIVNEGYSEMVVLSSVSKSNLKSQTLEKHIYLKNLLLRVFFQRLLSSPKKV